MDLMPWHPTPTPPSCSPLEHSADDMVLSSEVSEADPARATARSSAEATSTGRDTLTAMEVSSDDAVNQIRHYRYNLATWLDVCDTRQFFGTIVSVMALRSKHIRNALLVLSAASLAAPKGDILAERPNEPSESVIIADAHDPISTSLDHHVYTLLLAVANFLRETPAAWTEMWQRVHLSLLADPLSAPEHGLHLSCLRLRLDITVALMQGTGMLLHHAENVPSPATALGGDSSTSTVKDITGGNMVYTVHKMLLLCARILDFRAGVRRQVGVSRMQQWHQLAESANHWYAKRPMAFQPLVDLDLPSSVFGTAEAASAEEAGEDAITRPKGAPTHDELHPLFPSILFTNGTAVLSNQLYHTAMMLLLQSKPRTTIHEQSGVGGGGLNGGSRPSPAWSPLWHAQRVCGIALSNIRRECWDLSLVASLWVAAQTMTYEPQQRALLRGFDALATRMGWQVDHFQVTLRQVWGMES
ncbi:hypothetical protein SBRCBS47491_009457 [Sporothrix bragantina]|uniref:C6 zinc finger domain containing protein n=1 Tax=Sporothrix bragantina TaxID=671064 RepID=A0ABP0CY14_9PEZI